MPLHIFVGVATCGGLLFIVPRLRRTICHQRVQSDPLAYSMAARQFAHDVEKRLAPHLFADTPHGRQQVATLLISHDEWGGTHYDIVPTSRLMPRNTRVQIFHTLHLPIDQQPTDPQSIAYRAYSGLHHGSFGHTNPLPVPTVTRARITRVLPTLDMLNTWTEDTTTGTNGGAA